MASLPPSSSLASSCSGRSPASAQQRGCRGQHGQGSVEFLLAAVPVLLIGLSAIEATHWHFTRQAISLALAQAARVAITQHADPAALDNAFANALLPLHAGTSSAQALARLQRGMSRRERDTGLPAWRLRIRSPSVASFQDYASHDPELGHLGPLPVIDNDYLHEQQLERLAQGWPDGRGPASGQNALEANTLVVHLTWLHEPLLPGVRNLLRQLAPSDSRYGSLAMARGGYLPIQREIAFVMQSHAVASNMPDHGRIVRLARSDADDDGAVGIDGRTPVPDWNTGGTDGSTGQRDAAEHDGVPADGGPTGSSSSGNRPCTGLWCLAPIVQGRGDTAPPAGADASPRPGSDPGSADKTGTESAYPTPDGNQRDAGLDTEGEAPPWETDPMDCPGCCG